MTNEEKNKYLVKNILKECWHEPEELNLPITICKNCNIRLLGVNQDRWNIDFYTSDSDQQAINFFKLWRAINEHEIFYDLYEKKLCADTSESVTCDWNVFDTKYIDCSALANAIGEYFKWGEVE